MTTMQEFANWLQACPEDKQALLDLQLDLNAALVEGMPPLVILTQIALHFADNGLPDAGAAAGVFCVRAATPLMMAATAGAVDTVQVQSDTVRTATHWT